MLAVSQMEAGGRDFKLPLEAKFSVDMILLLRLVTYVSTMGFPVVTKFMGPKQAKS